MNTDVLKVSNSYCKGKEPGALGLKRFHMKLAPLSGKDLNCNFLQHRSLTVCLISVNL